MELQYLFMGAFGYMATHINTLLSLLFACILHYTPYQMYVFTKPEMYNQWLTKHVKYSSHITNNLPYGFIIGKEFIGYSEFDGTTYNDGKFAERMCKIITTRKYIDFITTCNEEIKSPEIVIEKETKTTNSIYIVIPSSAQLYWDKYLVRKITISFHPTQSQEKIMQRTLNIFSKQKHGVIFINGPPGTGKTMTSMLMAQQLGGILITGFDALTANFNYSGLHTHMQREHRDIKIDELPIILQLDEVDKIIEDINKPTADKPKESQAMFKSKGGWNGFFDLIDRGIHQNLIVVMTSNKKISDITDDPSYFRKGRVDEVFEMNEVIGKDIKVD